MKTVQQPIGHETAICPWCEHETNVKVDLNHCGTHLCPHCTQLFEIHVEDEREGPQFSVERDEPHPDDVPVIDLFGRGRLYARNPDGSMRFMGFSTVVDFKTQKDKKMATYEQRQARMVAQLKRSGERLIRDIDKAMGENMGVVIVVAPRTRMNPQVSWTGNVPDEARTYLLTNALKAIVAKAGIDVTQLDKPTQQ